MVGDCHPETECHAPHCEPPPPPAVPPSGPPSPLAVDFEGETFDVQSHLLLSQGGGPSIRLEVEIRPGSVQAANTDDTLTTVWPLVASVELAAVLEEEIDCADVRGIAGGCATLPRNGHRVVLHTETLGLGGDPCTAPAPIAIDRDIANDLLTVTATGNGGGPGIWRIEALVQTRELPAGSCTPATSAAHPAGSATEQAPQVTVVSLRVADIVPPE